MANGNPGGPHKAKTIALLSNNEKLECGNHVNANFMGPKPETKTIPQPTICKWALFGLWRPQNLRHKNHTAENEVMMHGSEDIMGPQQDFLVYRCQGERYFTTV